MDAVTAAAPTAPQVADRRSALTARMLQAPIVPMLLSMAWPNILVMLAQSSSGLIETFWISRLGTDALAGMALVFPAVMLMQMISGGAMGGGISSAVARALGAGARQKANALVLHAVAVNAALGVAFAILFLIFGPSLYRLLGGQGASLRAALTYSNIAFSGNALLWVMNALASVIRGTGNMKVPATVTIGGVVLLVPISPCLIFGLGPFPALGVAGGGTALVLYYLAGTAVLGWYILSGRNIARFVLVRLQWALFHDILRVGLVAAFTSLLTNITIATATAMVGSVGGPDAVAGFGTGARLEYLLIPLVFGFGAPIVALVGTNIGAGQRGRALRIALIGGAISFAVTEAIGLLAAAEPRAWLGIFGSDPSMLATGSAYLRAVGPAYGFFGLGMGIYFASQGAGKLFWPLCCGILRVVIAVGGGWLALTLTGSLSWMFAALALGLFAYGVTLTAAIASGGWFRRQA
jgi:putative MATE family efflux protein